MTAVDAWASSHAVDALERMIDGTNNGYLFVPTGREIDLARAHPDRFVVTSGSMPPNFSRIYTTRTHAVWFNEYRDSNSNMEPQ